MDFLFQYAMRGGATGPDTRTTQVFINFGDNASLDAQGFAPFGRVTKGMEVVDKIASVKTTTTREGMENVPVTPVLIIGITEKK